MWHDLPTSWPDPLNEMNIVNSKLVINPFCIRTLFQQQVVVLYPLWLPTHVFWLGTNKLVTIHSMKGPFHVHINSMTIASWSSRKLQLHHKSHFRRWFKLNRKCQYLQWCYSKQIALFRRDSWLRFSLHSTRHFVFSATFTEPAFTPRRVRVVRSPTIIRRGYTPCNPHIDSKSVITSVSTRICMRFQ